MSIRTLVFDFGNVLCYFDHRMASGRLARYSDLPANELHTYLFGGTLESDYECGRLSTTEFIRRVKEECRIQCSDEQFIEDYNDIFWPNHLLVELIPSLAQRFRLLLLSNTNELHLRRFRPMFEATFARFDALFFSHVVGARKPSAAIYATVQQAANCAAEECLFFDDVAVNVEAARAFGWQAIQFRSVEDVVVAVG